MKRLIAMAVLAGCLGSSSALAYGSSSSFSPWYHYDRSVTWRWVHRPSCPTDFLGDGCWQVQVRASTGCSGGVFVTLDEKHGGVIIGTVLGTLQNLPPGQTGQLELDSDGGESMKGSIAEIDCYNF